MTHYLMYAAPWYADDERRAKDIAENLGLLEPDGDAPAEPDQSATH